MFSMPDACRLADDFHLDPGDGHQPVITLVKRLRTAAPGTTKQQPVNLSLGLAESPSSDPAQDFLDDHGEMVELLLELREREEELARIKAQLEDHNRGPADEMNSRLLSRLVHEFRTPIASILALTHILAEEIDGPLSPEQHKQVQLIRESAEQLLETGDRLMEPAMVSRAQS
jgi:signal transduction histidine kinase